MKKKTQKKLILSKNTIVRLGADDLIEAAGGISDPSICSLCAYTINWCVDTL